MSSQDDDLGSVHGIVLAASDDLTTEQQQEVWHLIDHGEPVEALRTLAWIISDEKLVVDRRPRTGTSILRSLIFLKGRRRNWFNMVTAAELKRRWTEPDRLRLVRETRDWLTGHGPKPDGLGEHNGRTDLRGIPLFATPAMIGDRDNPAGGITWDSLDLSGAQLDQLRVFAGHLTNCCFDNASLLSTRLWGSTITDCTFQRADLHSSALGTGEWHGHRNTWQRVAFDRANLREVTFTAAVLDDCTFEKTSKQLMFVDCEIHDCTFTGQLSTLAIDGRGHRYPVDPSAISANFRNASVREFSIMGYRLDRVHLPRQEDIVVLHRYPTVLRSAAAWLKRPDATEAERRWSGMFDYTLGAPGAEDSDYCFDLNGYGDPELIAVAGRALAHAHGASLT